MDSAASDRWQQIEKSSGVSSEQSCVQTVMEIFFFFYANSIKCASVCPELIIFTSDVFFYSGAPSKL